MLSLSLSLRLSVCMWGRGDIPRATGSNGQRKWDWRYVNVTGQKPSGTDMADRDDGIDPKNALAVTLQWFSVKKNYHEVAVNPNINYCFMQSFQITSSLSSGGVQSSCRRRVRIRWRTCADPSDPGTGETGRKTRRPPVSERTTITCREKTRRCMYKKLILHIL